MAKEAKILTKDQIELAGGEDKLKRVFLPLDDNGDKILEVIVCIPDRRTMGQYLKYNNTNPFKAQEILVKNCLLTDKDQVLADDALFLTCVSELANLIPIRETIVKKY